MTPQHHSSPRGIYSPHFTHTGDLCSTGSARGPALTRMLFRYLVFISGVYGKNETKQVDLIRHFDIY